MEKVQGIEAKCGTCGSTQHLFMPQHSEAEARVLAEMMDGTSSFYVYPPKADRSDCLPGSLGRCGACATAEPQRTGVFKCTLFGYAERAPAKVIQLATRVQVGDEPVSGMVLPEVTSPFAISESAVKAGIDMEVKVVDVPEIVDAVNKSGVPVGALTSDPMMVTRATTDGKPPRPGFENAPTPAPYVKRITAQRGRFSFRPYPPPPKSRPARARRQVDLGESVSELATAANLEVVGLPVAGSNMVMEHHLSMFSCYYCGREEDHDLGCPGENLMRRGECWLVMDRHFQVVLVNEAYVVGHLAYMAVRTTYSKVTLDMLRVPPKRIKNCPCRDVLRAHERAGW